MGVLDSSQQLVPFSTTPSSASPTLMEAKEAVEAWGDEARRDQVGSCAGGCRKKAAKGGQQHPAKSAAPPTEWIAFGRWAKGAMGMRRDQMPIVPHNFPDTGRGARARQDIPCGELIVAGRSPGPGSADGRWESAQSHVVSHCSVGWRPAAQCPSTCW